MYSYCLFCERQRCSAIAQLIELRPGIRCISPRIIQRKWKEGKCLEQIHDWLPGYLFLYTEEPMLERIHLPGIIRWLGYGELEGSDRAFAEMLYEKNGVMGIIRLAKVGDRCNINDPLWKNTEGKIIKIDRGRKRCCVEILFDDVQRTIWLGYDLIQPKEKEKTKLPDNPESTEKKKTEAADKPDASLI